MKYLSESTSFPFWPSWMFSTASLFNFALVTMSFLLLVVHHTKPLSPEEWTHWRILSACNYALFFLSRISFLTNLHHQVSSLVQLTFPPSSSSKETRVWRFWPLQELPWCLWHFVKHPVCMASFGMISSLHCELELLTYPACPKDLP